MADVEGLKKGYEAFSQGDLDGAPELWADDIKWEGPNEERIPGGGTHSGKDEAKQALAKIAEDFESFSSPPDEIIEAEDTVVVLGHAEGKTKSGNELKVPFVHIWRFEGDKIKRGQLLTDTSEVLKALE
jgi:uncharacterized protein